MDFPVSISWPLFKENLFNLLTSIHTGAISGRRRRRGVQWCCLNLENVPIKSMFGEPSQSQVLNVNTAFLRLERASPGILSFALLRLPAHVHGV